MQNLSTKALLEKSDMRQPKKWGMQTPANAVPTPAICPIPRDFQMLFLYICAASLLAQF
jgi:hypothetical protein